MDGDYQSKPGMNCLYGNDTQDALNLLKVLMPELTKRALNYYCSDMKAMPYMNEDQIQEHLAKYYAPRVSIFYLYSSTRLLW